MKKGKFMKKLIILIVVMVIGYTAIAIMFQYKTGLEISSQLTMGWFGFWGVEIVNLAIIKRGKLKSPDSFGMMDDELLSREYTQGEETLTEDLSGLEEEPK